MSRRQHLQGAELKRLAIRKARIHLYAARMLRNSINADVRARWQNAFDHAQQARRVAASPECW